MTYFPKKNFQKLFFQKQTKVSIIETCKESFKLFSHNSCFSFNTHNMPGTTTSQTPEQNHQQILFIATDNICKYFVNLP